MIPLSQYLTPTGQQVIEYVSKAHFKIRQSGHECSNVNFAGATLHDKKTVLICVQNIINATQTSEFIEETVYHESVHVAQNCNNGKILGIPKNEMHLSPYKLQNVKTSLSLIRDPSMKSAEYEAYWLEDKPEKVLYYLKKFCF